MIFKYKFCLWLIDTLILSACTLPEIQKKWLNASANEEGMDTVGGTDFQTLPAGSGIIDVRRHQNVISTGCRIHIKLLTWIGFKNYEFQHDLKRDFQLGSCYAHSLYKAIVDKIFSS